MHIHMHRLTLKPLQHAPLVVSWSAQPSSRAAVGRPDSTWGGNAPVSSCIISNHDRPPCCCRCLADLVQAPARSLPGVCTPGHGSGLGLRHHLCHARLAGVPARCLQPAAQLCDQAAGARYGTTCVDVIAVNNCQRPHSCCELHSACILCTRKNHVMLGFRRSSMPA